MTGTLATDAPKGIVCVPTADFLQKINNIRSLLLDKIARKQFTRKSIFPEKHT